MIRRMLRAAWLEPGLYDEVEQDTGATLQAIIVVALSSIAAGVGSFLALGPSGLVLVTVSAFVAWMVGSVVIYFVSMRLLPSQQTEMTYGQLLRVIGFSSSPGIMRVLGLVPFISTLVNILASLWMLLAMIIAVRQALHYTTPWQPVAAAVIGSAIQVGVLVALPW